MKMTTKELLLIKQIFIDNSIIHFIDTDKNIPTDVYTIYARYRTETKTINKNILTMKHKPSVHLFEIMLGDRLIYSKTYSTKGIINISKVQHPNTEDSLICEIIQICQNKTNLDYIKQLQELKHFLHQLKEK